MFVVTTFAAFATPAGRAATLEILAVTDQAAPDGNGAFTTFGDAVLNNLGQAVFVADLGGTSGARTTIEACSALRSLMARNW